MSEKTHSAFVPGLLLALAVIGWSTFQLAQLATERDSLRTAISEQDKPMEQSKQVRERLDSLAARVARLARSGNANATIIVEQLRQRGITINQENAGPDLPQ